MTEIASEPDPKVIEEICRKVREFMRVWVEEFLKEAPELPVVSLVDIELPAECNVAVIDIFRN